MIKNFKEFLHYCMGERVEELGEIHMQDEDYKSVLEEQSELFNQLRNSTPDDLKPLLSAYSEKNVELASLEESYYFKHGFMDAVKFIFVLWSNDF